MQKNSLVITLVVALIVGAAAFFGGMKYQESKRTTAFRQFPNVSGRGNAQFNGGNRAGIRPVNGEIISSDDKSITVKLTDGSSKIVLVSDKTTINKASEAQKADLKTGETVAVFGSENTDGSVTAQNIQLNPILRVMPNASPGT